MPKRTPPRTAWKKGQSGNPAGRITEKVITDQIRLALNECVEVEIEGEGGQKKKQKVKRLRLLAQSIVEKAIMGSRDHAALVLDRVEGKVPQALDVKSEHTVTHKSESLSRFSEWLTEAAAGAANGHDPDVGTERPVLPDQVPPGTSRH